MKLVSFLHGGRSSYGTLAGDRVVDLGARLAPACPTLRLAIASHGLTGLRALAARHGPELDLADLVLLPPIPDPERIICIGLNYKAHAEEGGFKLPVHPSSFVRMTSTLVGHGGAMLLPHASGNFDFEGELAVIIGAPGRAITREHALEHVFGYSCFNDGSVRDFQFTHSLTAGKNFPATGGFGPCITTADELPDPSALNLTTRLNGEQVQHKGTDDMIFDVASLVAYVSTWTPLSCGDVIATGTPEGVGFARKPPLWMRAGDVVEVEISGIGVLRNPVVAEADR